MRGSFSSFTFGKSQRGRRRENESVPCWLFQGTFVGQRHQRCLLFGNGEGSHDCEENGRVDVGEGLKYGWRALPIHRRDRELRREKVRGFEDES